MYVKSARRLCRTRWRDSESRRTVVIVERAARQSGLRHSMQRMFSPGQCLGERRHMRHRRGTSAPQMPHVDGLVALTTWKVPQASAADRVLTMGLFTSLLWRVIARRDGGSHGGPECAKTH
jgi:hypothetical protein